MQSLKEWLNTSGIPFENTAWLAPPQYPYGVYLDSYEARGADEQICISQHNVTVEIYVEFVTGSILQQIESLFCAAATPYEFMGWTWIESEKHYRAAYEIGYTRKEGKEWTKKESS